MYLINVKEALGYSHEQTLDSSYVLIEGMLQEYAYFCNERNKLAKSENEEGKDDEHGAYTWVDVVDFDTGKPKRVKQYQMI